MWYIIIGAIVLVAILVTICRMVFRGVAGRSKKEIALEEIEKNEEAEEAEEVDLICAICIGKDDCPYGLKPTQDCGLLPEFQVVFPEENHSEYRRLIFKYDIISAGDEWCNPNGSWLIVESDSAHIGRLYAKTDRLMRRRLLKESVDFKNVQVEN